MLIALLLAVAPQDADLNLSPAVRAVMAERSSLSNAAFIAKIDALADRDDASAIELLGEVYEFGRFDVTVDPARACELFARAANRRGDSAHNLALCYETGNGLPADPAKARTWYQRGAALGNSKSICALGNMMISGAGGARDIAGGVALCRRSAEAGDPDAQADLGNFLIAGKEVKKDAVEARKWYTLAAEQKQANAAFVLAQIYWNGDGIAMDRAAAERWWKVAYEGGRKDAAGWISLAIFKQMSITRDGKGAIDRALLPEYVAWLERAATEEPDPARRSVYAASLAMLKGNGK